MRTDSVRDLFYKKSPCKYAFIIDLINELPSGKLLGIVSNRKDNVFQDILDTTSIIKTNISRVLIGY